MDWQNATLGQSRQIKPQSATFTGLHIHVWPPISFRFRTDSVVANAASENSKKTHAVPSAVKSAVEDVPLGSLLVAKSRVKCDVCGGGGGLLMIGR